MITVTSRLKDIDTQATYHLLQCGERNSEINARYIEHQLRDGSHKPHLYFLAHGHSGTEGFAVVTCMLDQDGSRKAYLELICSHSRKGSVLMRAVIDVAARLHLDHVQLTAATGPLRRYYERFGFRRVPYACLRRKNIMNLRLRKQYTRVDGRWQGYVDDAQDGAPRSHHTDGDAEGYIMSLCLKDLWREGPPLAAFSVTAKKTLKLSKMVRVYLGS